MGLSRWRVCCLIACQICLQRAYSQSRYYYQVEVGALAASDQTPFWLRANQYGTVPLKAQLGRFDARLYGQYRPPDSTGHRPRFDWGYGINGVVNAATQTQLLVPEAYLKGRWGAFELYAGRRREMVGLVDTLLTTGAYAWSGNALPIPKIQLGVFTFTPLPFTKGVVSVMGAYSHGWFENSDRLVTGSYLHQKYLYARVGKPSWSFRLYAGMNHQVMWAGYYAGLPAYLSKNGHLPSSFKHYIDAVFGIQGSVNDPTLENSFELNRIGNHLGSIDLAADIDLTDWNLYAYRQFLYDDGSLASLINVADGLNGLRLKNRRYPTREAFFLRQITLEYLYTANQGGEVFIIDDPLHRGRDDYFNHGQFLDGWTYYGRTIGTPFLTPTAEVRATLPYRYGIANNRVSAFHLAMSALIASKVDITARLSLSSNSGTYNVPYQPAVTQFSTLLTAAIPMRWLGGTVLAGSLAIDIGDLLPNSVGGYLALRKRGVLDASRNRPKPAPASTRWVR